MYNVMHDPRSMTGIGWTGSLKFGFKLVLYVSFSFPIEFTCNLVHKVCFMYLTLNHWTLGEAYLLISVLLSGYLTQGFTYTRLVAYH